jgi:hypothetical protein
LITKTIQKKHGQSKQETKVIKKQTFEKPKKKFTFKFGLKKGSQIWKACSSHTCKNMKGVYTNLKQEEQQQH